MENLWLILSGAPWWVYLLFVYLVTVGVKSIQPRTVPVKRVILLPLLFVTWSFYNLYTRLVLGHMSLLLLWVVFLSIGAYLGIREVRNWKISINRNQHALTIPGNYSTLILILLIFILKFVWGYIYATHEPVSYWIYFWDILTSSLVTGFFVGRAWFFFRRGSCIDG